MPISRSVTIPALFVSLLTLSLAAQAGDFTGFLYVSDYGAQNLDRYSYTYTEATKTISNITPAGAGGSTISAVFITDGIVD